MAAKKKAADKPMGISRSTLVEKVRSVTVHYFGDRLTVEYKPSVWTALREQEQRSHNRNGTDPDDDEVDVIERLVKPLAEAMTGWDVIEDDGSEIPPTVENLATFPSALLAHINDTINADMFPNYRRARR